MYICGAFRSNEQGLACSLLDVSHTTAPILGKAEHDMDSSGQYLLIAIIHTAKVRLYRLRLGAAEGTSAVGKVKHIIATATRVENTAKTEHSIA